MLLYLAINFFFQWLYQSYFKLSLFDYLLVILILIAIGLFGFLKSLILGLIKFFPDMDHGVEWCEEEILVSQEDGGIIEDQYLVDQDDFAFWEPSFEDTFKYLETQEEFDRILKKMEEEVPGIVARFHKHIIFILCERVTAANTTLRALLG